MKNIISTNINLGLHTENNNIYVKGGVEDDILHKTFSIVDLIHAKEELGAEVRSTSLFSDIFTLNVKTPLVDMCSLQSRSEFIMRNMMRLNYDVRHRRNERINKSLTSFSSPTKSNSGTLPNERITPTYAEGSNYSIFQEDLQRNEDDGLISNKKLKRGNKLVTPYDEVENLYYNEFDTNELYDVTIKEGVYNNSSLIDNSLLGRTKKMFQSNKLGTIVSKFATNTQGEDPINHHKDAPLTKYGLSHGRNLLLKSTETNVDDGYDINGYKNPYCRVWTHHYQYDKIGKMMRPFTNIEKDGTIKNEEQPKLTELHKWNNFLLSDKDIEDLQNSDGNVYGFKDYSNRGWEYSVLDNKTMLPNFTPRYADGDWENKLHTRNVMFSIENLAWKDYDPYSFETALSWEQRGPNGGRIMYFPPYGLTFSEDVSVDWNEESFIGRGERVYTYKNSARRGSLSFMIVVDHPSIIDYISQGGDSGQGAKDFEFLDTDYLRFFAGCEPFKEGEDTSVDILNEKRDSVELFEDIIDSKAKNKTNPKSQGMLGLVKPTHLDDEYPSDKKPEIQPQKEKEAEPMPVNNEPEQNNDSDDYDLLEFMVFYPNNYSGYYDKPTNNNSNVHSIAYLLSGIGSNTHTNKKTNDTKDLNLEYKSLVIDENTNYGYEMSEKSVTESGAEKLGHYMIGLINGKKHIPKKWYYRVDGVYEGKDLSNIINNKLNEKLVRESNYFNKKSFNLNSDYQSVKNNYSEEKNNENLVSLLDFAIAISELDKLDNVVTELRKINGKNEDNITKIKKVITDRKLKNIDIIGYSNEHGNNSKKEVNKKRNDNLALNRANTLKNWLLEILGGKFKSEDIITKEESISSVKLEKKDKVDVSSLSAKIYRSARVRFKFLKEETKNLTDIDNGKNTNPNEITENIAYTKTDVKTLDGRDVYKDSKGQSWVLNKDSKTYTLYTEEVERVIKDIADKQRTRARELDINKIRYDQEYRFFKELKHNDPFNYKKITDKIKYFNPVFHSMTPEGFSSRLTFLQQCTRQGDTITRSDKNGKTAKNLAFGRPPFCVLRIGDFYNQMIVIKSISFKYDNGGIKWDLNPEGIGLIPMFCEVNISFEYVGGSSMSGAINKLQNALSFNYYANTELYDNRADREYLTFDRETGKKEKATQKYIHNVRKEK